MKCQTLRTFLLPVFLAGLTVCATAKPSSVKDPPAPLKTDARIVDGLAWGWPWLFSSTAKITKNLHDPVGAQIEIRDKAGGSVLAAADGEVISIHAFRGVNAVAIGHHFACFSTYEYSGKPLVREGQQVRRGQKIGEMSRILQFRISSSGNFVDPLSYLPNTNRPVTDVGAD